MRSYGGNGLMPALAIVKAYWNIEMPRLSHALWGSARFPYIFFFSTEELNLTWEEFKTHVGYSPNYRPPALVHKVKSDKLANFDGPFGYIKFLRENYRVSPQSTYSANVTEEIIKDELPDASRKYRSKVLTEANKLFVNAMQDDPQLTDDAGVTTTTVVRPARSEAFRIDVRQAYGRRCAICGIRLETPEGKPEVHAAHIYPKAENGSDDVRNGLCLCHMHHWAFDAGWFSIADDLTIMIHENLPKNEDYDFIRKYAGKPIAKPLVKGLEPHPIFLEAHRKKHGYD